MATLRPTAIPAAPTVLQVLGRFDRQSLASFITVAIDLLDVVDGDNDAEPNGDEQDGNASEDEFMHHGHSLGCPIADPGEDDDPGGGNVEDEGENADAEDTGEVADYGEDQRELRWRHGSLRAE